MRGFIKWLCAFALLLIVGNVNAVIKEFEFDQKLTTLEELDGQNFAIVNETDGKAFYGTTNQNLGYDLYESAFVETNTAISFRLVAAQGDDVSGKFYLQSVKADGTDYSIWGGGYLNSQPATGGCCFIMGLAGQNGQDGLNLAVWDIEVQDGGFALKNLGTGLYLMSNDAAKYDEPTYFSFYTLKEIESVDPLAAQKTDLSDAIAKGKIVPAIAYTEASFAAVAAAVTAGEDALADVASTAESLTVTTTAINNAIAALELKEGFSNLTSEMFMTWDSATEPTTGNPTGCVYELFNPSGMPFGDPNVGYLNFVNLQGYDMLYITYSDGTPRIMMNRDIDQGQWSAEESESHLIEFPRASEGWAAKYFTNENGVVTVDLNQMVADKGIANLNTIKGANWADVTVTGLFLYNAPASVDPDPVESIYIETDLTAQFPVDYQGWTGATGLVGWAAPAVITNDGREISACEKYEGTCANTGDVFTRTLTGLANGTYRIELYGAAAYTSGRGFESELVEGDETAVYLYAETAAGLVKQYIPAHVATDFNGTGIATAVLDNVVITDGTVKLGMYKEMPYTNWHVVQIKGVTAKVDVTELHAAALEAAQTALASEDYAVVTGEERTALETAVTNNITVAEQTADAYEAAVEALSEATTAFTAAKIAYADYAAAQVYLVDLPYAKAEKKPVAEAATNATDAAEKTAALIPALRAYYESNAALENVEGAVDMTNLISNPAAEEAIDAEVWKTVLGEGPGGAISILSNEPWTDAAGVASHNYFDGGNWGAQAWDVTLQQEITLPAGKYLLTAKMRASNDVEQSLFAGENSTTGLSVGAAGGVFDRGWNDTSVEFELTEEATIPIGVRGVTEKQYNWMSFSDFRLVQLQKAEAEIILTLNAPVGEEVTLTFGVYDTEDTFTVDFGGEDNAQTAKVGIDNKGPVREDGTTAGATKFTGTVAGDGTIKVYGNNDIWYLITTNGAMPTTLDQPKLMNVVQMGITGADVESVTLPAYPKMTQFSFNNSSVKSVDVTKVPTLTSLTINNTTASKYEAQLESIDLSQNTELAYLSLQGNARASGKLTTLDLTNNTKLDGMGLYVQYNALTEIKFGENTLTAMNVQNNQLTSLDWTKLTGLKNLYASNNKLAGEVDLSANAKFENVQLNNNELTSVKLPDVTKQLAIQDNKFTLATLPVQPASLNTTSKTKKFTYAPQAALEVPEIVSELDLTSQLTVAQGELNPEAVGEAAAYTTWLENQTTTFSFVTAGGTALVEGTDYEVVEPGKFKFLTDQTEKVHGVMLNAAFPKFTESVPFTTTEFSVEVGGEPLFADGTYYIYNVGAGKYLGAGADWSTHTIVDDAGLDYYLSYNEGKYTIDSRVSNGGDSQYLNGEWNDGPMFGWTIKDEGNGYYMISDGNQFLAAQEDGLVVMTNDSTLSYLWTLVTLEQRLAEMANASAENPVDATFLIQGANFNRNDQRNYAWSMEANNWTLSGGTYENRCAETYHTTFTLAQTLYNAPAGKYLVSAQGFYRQDGEIEELPVFYANTSTAEFPVNTGTENSMSDASESFSAGLYNIEPFIVNVPEAGALTIGVRGTALSQWVIFDNFRLTYLSSEVAIDDIAANYAQVLADAVAALESEHYAMVTGIERTSLEETIEAYSSVANDQDTYTVAINNLSYATNYFTNAKDAYESLIKAKELLAISVDNYPYADPWYKEEAVKYAELTAQMADEAYDLASTITSYARRIAESHALLEGVERSSDMTEFIMNPNAYDDRNYWELVYDGGGYIVIRSNEPLTDADYRIYPYFDGGYWESDYWNVALQQEIYLPAGRYQLTVSSRASSDVAFTLYAGDESVAMPTIGAEGGLFGNGWNDTSLEFEVPEEGPVTIGVRGESNVIYNWMSFTRFRLAKFPNAADFNNLYIAEDTNLSRGNAILPISLQNEDEIVGLQFDVVLPYDMNLTEIESGFRSGSHGVSFNQMNNNTFRVVMASMDNEVIEGYDGVLMNLGLEIPAYLSAGWYDVILRNVVMTTSSLQTIKCADQSFGVKITGRMGDVNSDNVIDVTDVVMIIDNILEHYDADFNATMADVNYDGYIDVTDVVNVIDVILGKIELSRGAEPIDRSAYTAFQMDLTIPAGYVLESVSLTDIAKDSHSLTYTMLPDGRCRVVVCSMNNEALPGAWNEVIRLNLRGNGDAQVNIDRAVFVTIDGERHELMMNPTSIAELSTLNSQISTRYDLQGRKVEKNAKGILIENGKKTVRK